MQLHSYVHIKHKLFSVCFISEVLSNAAVSAKLADTKAAGEVKALDSFYQMLQNEPDRAFYG